ncbi:hypothetical protein D3OALGA1CA_5377 [Olavius algarvensis associated proteobacterium Delta 3]|nr:hypothetical protein D3OALGB2SA_1524 [Olavius algarvensis associated proteobacterium Delta 3]CAB5165838.1 hypothetical protein D3OALGA1CA_5377 [Olavius algarvensis associated proteobacterium Delta 3]
MPRSPTSGALRLSYDKTKVRIPFYDTSQEHPVYKLGPLRPERDPDVIDEVVTWTRAADRNGLLII